MYSSSYSWNYKYNHNANVNDSMHHFRFEHDIKSGSDKTMTISASAAWHSFDLGIDVKFGNIVIACVDTAAVPGIINI